MPLNVDNTAVKNFQVVVPEFGGSLMVGTVAMIIGIPVWTESNIQEVWERISFSEAVSGPFRNRVGDDGIEPYPFTKEQVIALVGARTNASAITKAKFIRHNWDLHCRWLS